MTISSIVASVQKFAVSKPAKVMAKTLAVATSAAVLYDTHINGCERSVSSHSVESAERYEKQFDQYMSMDKSSATISKMKKGWFNFQRDFSLFHIYSKAKGYLKGAGATLLEDSPLILLSAVALKSKKLVVPAGVLLALNAVKTVLYDVMGIGRDK